MAVRMAGRAPMLFAVVVTVTVLGALGPDHGVTFGLDDGRERGGIM